MLIALEITSAGRRCEAATVSGPAPGSVGIRQHLARIHDPQRIERALDRLHGEHRALAVLAREVAALADADAVLWWKRWIRRYESFTVPVADDDAYAKYVPTCFHRPRATPHRQHNLMIRFEIFILKQIDLAIVLVHFFVNS